MTRRLHLTGVDKGPEVTIVHIRYPVVLGYPVRPWTGLQIEYAPSVESVGMLMSLVAGCLEMKVDQRGKFHVIYRR